MDAQKLEQLSAYLDGELTPSERADVERLLAGDAEARSLLAELKQVSRLVSTLPRAASPDLLAERVTSQMERESLIGAPVSTAPASLALLRWMRPLTVAACLAIVGSVGWLAWPTLKPKLQLPLPALERSAPTVAKMNAPSPDHDNVGLPDTTMATANAPAAVSARDGSAPGGTGTPSGSSGQRNLFALNDESNARRNESSDSANEDQSVVAAMTPSMIGTLENAHFGYTNNGEVPEAPIDVLLAKNQLTNEMVQSADESAFGNTLEVEVADPAVTVQLASLIESNMAMNAVPDLGAAPPDQRIEVSEPFYFARQAPVESPDRVDSKPRRSVTQRQGEEITTDGAKSNASQDPDDETFSYCINLPREQAMPLLKSLKKVVDENAVDAAWITNSESVSAERVPEEVMRRADMNASNYGMARTAGVGRAIQRDRGVRLGERDGLKRGLVDYDSTPDAAEPAAESAERAKDDNTAGEWRITAKAVKNDQPADESEDQKSSSGAAGGGMSPKNDRQVGAGEENCKTPPTPTSCRNDDEAAGRVAATQPAEESGRVAKSGSLFQSEDKADLNAKKNSQATTGITVRSAGGRGSADLTRREQTTQPSDDMVTLAISLRTNRGLAAMRGFLSPRAPGTEESGGSALETDTPGGAGGTHDSVSQPIRGRSSRRANAARSQPTSQTSTTQPARAQPSDAERPRE